MTSLRSAMTAAIALMGVVMTISGGCSSSASGARSRYNEALVQYQQGQWETAAEGFLAARDQAGLDPVLRFQAAFNLGMAYAKQADVTPSAATDPAAGATPGAAIDRAAIDRAATDRAATDPQTAIQHLRQSAAWFRDAVRLQPENEDARVNLEVILRRIQLLADQLNRGQNSLEARLDRVIEDERGLREQIRELMDRVSESGSEAEPVAFQDDFDTLATLQRGLLADTGTVSDLAGEELDLLQNKAELTQEDQVRRVQLENLDQYLQQARGHLADTRRLLRRLQGDRAHRRADAGLADLKRAREQLLDPVTVLKGIAQDQTSLLMHTGALAQIRQGALTLRATPPADSQAEPPRAPAWLTDEHLNERQSRAQQRTGEVLARFQSGVSAGVAAAAAADTAPGAGAAAAGASDPETQRVLAAAAQAIPFLESASAAMDTASAALGGGQLAAANQAQGEALRSLFAAIERFSGIRDLIELTYRDHAGTTALLTPPDDTPAGQAAATLPPALAELSTEERTAQIGDLVATNVDRLNRLQGLFEDEIASLAAQAAQAGDAQGGNPQGGNPNAPGTAAPPPEQLEAAQQQYVQAQALRGQAHDALVQVQQSLHSDAGAARVAAAAAATHIETLRRLFFSIVEHLKELLQNQTETHDSTASASTASGEQLAVALGPLVDAEAQHAALGAALAQALAEQADAAAASGDPNQQEASERFGQAAEEVQAATAEMEAAADGLGKDAENAAVMSVDIGPILAAQQAAMEHLAEAIRLLEPPQQQEQNQDQDQDQNQEQQNQQEQQQEVSQQQAQRRLQEIRDREAERQRDQRRKQRFNPEPVEKDW